MPYMTTAAFRCIQCGHLEAAEHAGEEPVPFTCSCCGAGTVFDTKGNRTLQQGIWEVLADAAAQRLAELGLEVEQVARHSPADTATEDDVRCQANIDLLTAKEANWQAIYVQLQDDWNKLDQRLQALEAKESTVFIVEEMAKVKHALHLIEIQEFTPRDAAHKAKLIARLRDGPPAKGVPKHVSAFVREGVQSIHRSGV